MQPEDTRRIEDWALNPTVVDDSKGSRSGRQSEPERWGIADEQLPERLGRFRIVGMLGQGGMGRVLEAHDDTLDRRVAVKQLHQDAGPGHRQRMLREAQALARLSHPNVIQVYDAAEQDGRLFIAMELVDGQTLWDWHKTPRPWPECVRVYEEAARGLAAAHAEGIVHRDFKPANCIIDDRGRVKVLDFGLARGVDDMDEAEPSVEERVRTLGVAIDPVTVVEPGLTRVDGDLASPVAVVPRGDEDDARDGEAPPDSADASPSPARSDDAVGGRAIVDHSGALSLRLTQTGAMLGTPAYMAPEQAAGRPPDARSDQFSLCVALFEAIYGERPYAGSPGFALLADEGAGLEFPRVRAGLPGVPGWLRKVLARGLSADKVDRFPTMVALLEAIERGHRRRRRVGLAVAAAGVLAAAGLWMAGAREAAPCEGLRDAGLPGWGASQRTAVREALGSEGGERGEALWTATERGLDEYARAWSDVRARACEATHVERVASPELLELRSACLDARALRVQATVEQLSSADSQVAAHAAQAVRSLPPVEPCLDAERLRGVPPLPPALADDASEIL
ncbi:MAG: serine/threonine protein kinase, partial [Myxococcales bacterium]|nr:serine/threonine protein kinase [Myxococcales bacterium]